ncbi:hypothetical protein [Alkalihalobacterium alkalinitrilicum]|uniref:hypothetical protein n=1 Tax=Alkalihalobacterium alkalinitrilicum TaxID=427920 RepID=UPI0009956878|nr:hypothetical protein [Alkalihalobacterium alkalinitrilicum]
MIEEKALAIKFCNEITDVQEEFVLSPIGYQYIYWNQSYEYQTESFDWVTLNTHLKASLDQRSFTDQFIDVIQSVQTYADILKLIKSENELLDFQRFTKIIPFRKVNDTRG